MQGGWLDCRSEFVLFHGNLKKLSDCLVSQINSKNFRLTERLVMVRAHTIISRLISSDQGPWQPKKRITGESPSPNAKPNKEPAPTILPNSNLIALEANVLVSPRLRRDRHPPISKTYVFSLGRQAFLTDD
ncbi:hypothetical protein KDW61_08070 [Burkholderia cenocepacia]|uniref:hypothetical protein n=1 Tax=Burkholderia TaxID=32008 RepID=UPI00158CA367|nr:MULTISPECIES: hypothetical protein [Burkholderia]MBR8208614.1 hypothetical protein [Burkholderia cenocepacia]